MSNFKPMLFSTDMVRAILNGTKTQTRRLVKYQKAYDIFLSGKQEVEAIKSKENIKPNNINIGDIIWVRETFSEKEDRLIYRANVCSKYDLPNGFVWKPSLFMPKKHCRLFLEVTNVRIEKLNDISENDCLEEGIKREVSNIGETIFYFYPCNDLRDDSYLPYPKTSYYSLWKSINGVKSWEENHFVWVYTFKVVECPENFC